MSGQPAGTTPPTPTNTPAEPRLADVITFGGRRPGHLRAVEEAPVNGATPAAPDQRLADAIQKLYVARDLSLADPDTAAAYDVAMQAVALIIVDGLHQTGGLGEEEHRKLRAFLDAAALVPAYVTGTHTG